MHLPPRKIERCAFTLLELLTVVAIIGALAVLLLPAVNRAFESALGAKCLSHLKADGVAVLLYAADNNNALPINNGSFKTPDGQTHEDQYYMLIGPYLANQPKSGSAPYFRALPVFCCPKYHNLSESQLAQTIYHYNSIIGTATTPIPLTAVRRPSSTPLMWDNSGQSDSVNAYLASPDATKYGYTGPTSTEGLPPNHGRNCNMLFVGGNAAPVDLSNFNNFPWYGKVPPRNPIGTVFDPAYAGN